MRLRSRTARRISPRAALVAAGVVIALALVLFAPAPSTSKPEEPFSNSPMCKKVADCPRSGMLAREHGLEHYGIDNWVELGWTKVGNLIPSAIQSISALAWQTITQAINGALLLLEWAFSLKLTEDAMPELRGSLLDLHNNVLGTPWTLAAISIAGLWGLYNGLIRQQTIKTFTGLLATVLLMAGALWMINKPDDSVGEFSRLANDSALGFVGLGAGGSGEQAFGDASKSLFRWLVVDQWCVLQFVDHEFCFRKGLDTKDTVLDQWLAKPAWSDARKDLYEKYKDEDSTKENMRYQDDRGAFARIATLVMIAVALLGAICLLLYLALKLVIASVMTLALTLVAPVMLLAPAFGEAGRKAFVTWLKRLGGSIIAKLVYALFLGLVIFIAGTIAGIKSLDWGGRTLIYICFWWGVFFKRKDLVGFATGDSQGAMGGLGLLKAYLGYRAVRDVGGSVVRGASYLPRQGARGVGAAVRGGWRRTKWGHGRRAARDTAARDTIREDLRERAQQQAQTDRTDAIDTLKKERKYQDWKGRKGHKGPPPARPSEAEVQQARSVISRYGADTSREIAIRDADIERYVREQGSPDDLRQWEASQRPGLRIKEIREHKGDPQFKERVRRERQRSRIENRVERRRQKVYRR